MLWVNRDEQREEGFQVTKCDIIIGSIYTIIFSYDSVKTALTAHWQAIHEVTENWATPITTGLLMH